MQTTNALRLDSIPGCEAALAACNDEIGEFAADWATAAGELKAAEKRYERLYRSALRGTSGRNAEERQATAHAAVEGFEEGLAERIEQLAGEVEEYKTRFKTIDRRSDNTQSLLSTQKETAKIDRYVPRGSR